MAKQQQYNEYLNFGGTMTMEEWEKDGRYDLSMEPYYPYCADQEGLIDACLEWWEVHQHDTEGVEQGDGTVEHYNSYNETPVFVKIAQELKKQTKS